MGDTSPKNKEKLQEHKKKTGKNHGQAKLKRAKKIRKLNIQGARLR